VTKYVLMNVAAEAANQLGRTSDNSVSKIVLMNVAVEAWAPLAPLV